MVASFLIRAGASVTSVAIAPVTWNPLDKNAVFTLSLGNTRADDDQGAYTAAGIRGNIGKSAGKWVFELTAGSGVVVTGIANSSASLSSYFPNAAGVSAIARSDVGTWQVSSSVIGDFGSAPGEAATYTYAFDFDAELMWVSINGGNWNASGAADPATATGGWDFSSAASGPWFPFYQDDDASGSCIIRTSGLAKAIPSGFSAWEG